MRFTDIQANVCVLTSKTYSFSSTACSNTLEWTDDDEPFDPIIYTEFFKYPKNIAYQLLSIIVEHA